MKYLCKVASNQSLNYTCQLTYGKLYNYCLTKYTVTILPIHIPQPVSTIQVFDALSMSRFAQS